MSFWREDRHAQIDSLHVSAWVGIRRRAWIVGVQGALADPADARAVSFAVMVGPFYIGLEFMP